MNKNDLRLPFEYSFKTALKIYWLRTKLTLLMALSTLFLTSIYLFTRLMLLKVLPVFEIEYGGLNISSQYLVNILFPALFIVVIIVSTVSVVREAQRL